MKPFLKIIAISSIAYFNQGLAQNSINMTQPGDLSQGQGRPQVIGAEPANPSDWPATFIFGYAGGGCTSTAIGSNVVLTAAHCVEDGAQGTILVNGNQLSLTCNHHPSYPFNITADFALCLLNGQLTDIVFENVNGNIAYAQEGQNVTLLGYGCTTEGGFDQSFGVLHSGEAPVIASLGDDGFLYTVTEGGAALCFGDSGGASYFYTDPDKKDRAIIGVNSRGDISTYSFLSTTATDSFTSWAREWSQSQGVGEPIRICGLNPDAINCRR